MEFLQFHNFYPDPLPTIISGDPAVVFGRLAVRCATVPSVEESMSMSSSGA